MGWTRSEAMWSASEASAVTWTRQCGQRQDLWVAAGRQARLFRALSQSGEGRGARLSAGAGEAGQRGGVHVKEKNRVEVADVRGRTVSVTRRGEKEAAGRWAGKAGCAWLARVGPGDVFWGDFFFFIFKKIKILKIYVRFEKFQKYTPVAQRGSDRP